MARVLVTRAADQAEETAHRLRDLGHEPVIAPLRRVERLVERLDGPAPGRIVATSANAVLGIGFPEAWRACRFIAVGEMTATAARRAGFVDVAVAAGDARSAAALLLAGGVRPDPVLFLAGSPRKPDFETALAEAGQGVRLIETYRMAEHAALPAAVVEALRSGFIDAVLHFSAESAGAFLAALDRAGLPAAALHSRHIVLSADVAAPLRAAGIAQTAVAVARNPDQQALLDRLGPAWP